MGFVNCYVLFIIKWEYEYLRILKSLTISISGRSFKYSFAMTMFKRRVVVLAYELDDGLLKIVILLHFPDHFVVMLVVEDKLPDGEGTGGFQFKQVHLFPSQAYLYRSRISNDFQDIIVAYRK